MYRLLLVILLVIYSFMFGTIYSAREPYAACQEKQNSTKEKYD